MLCQLLQWPDGLLLAHPRDMSGRALETIMELWRQHHVLLSSAWLRQLLTDGAPAASEGEQGQLAPFSLQLHGGATLTYLFLM